MRNKFYVDLVEKKQLGVFSVNILLSYRESDSSNLDISKDNMVFAKDHAVVDVSEDTPRYYKPVCNYFDI